MGRVSPGPPPASGLGRGRGGSAQAGELHRDAERLRGRPGVDPGQRADVRVVPAAGDERRAARRPRTGWTGRAAPSRRPRTPPTRGSRPAPARRGPRRGPGAGSRRRTGPAARPSAAPPAPGARSPGTPPAAGPRLGRGGAHLGRPADVVERVVDPADRLPARLGRRMRTVQLQGDRVHLGLGHHVAGRRQQLGEAVPDGRVGQLVPAGLRRRRPGPGVSTTDDVVTTSSVCGTCTSKACTTVPQ